MSIELPEDFDSFWQDTAAEAMGAPLDCHRSLKNDYNWPGFTVETLSFRAIDGKSLHGWLAYPEGARRLPGFMWLAPYGRESMLPNEYGTREGFASLSFNFHGEPAFHRESYVTPRGYFSEGADNPETWVFRQMFINAVIATRILQAQVEVHEDQIGTMGMSQGGGMSIWLGAWCPVIKAVCADMPFLGNIARTLTSEVYRYPLKEVSDFMETVPLGRERVLHTVSYFDTAHQATRCKVPTHVSLGLKDPAAKPGQVRHIFDALAGPKELIEYGVGHDWTPEMIGNNRKWLLHYLQA